jgi:AAA ATPase domain
MKCADRDHAAYPRRIRIYRISNTGFFVIARPQCVGVRRRSGSECNVGTDLPLIARRAELAILTGAIEATRRGRGDAVLLTGEAGVGKTRLLIETQREAERRGVLVLKGRAIESGGAYRPLVEAFARASAPFAQHPS